MTNPQALITGTPMPESQPPRDARREFLENRLAFSHDPFAHAVAEQELAHQSEHFFAYVDTGEKELSAELALLEEPRHAVVFGAPGTGKTTLRLNLARNLAKYKPHILPVTCEPSHLETPGGELFEEYLVSEIAKDLLLVLLRQSGSFEPGSIESIDPAEPTMRLVAWLLQQRVFQRPLRRIVDLPDGEVLHPFVASLGRRERPPEVTSPALRSAVAALLKSAPADADDVRLKYALEAAKNRGLDTLFVLVDGLDAVERSASEMLSMLRPFWNLASPSSRGLFLKLFLPAGIEEPIGLHLKELQQPFDQPHNLEWSPAQLLAALLRRVRAARSDMRTVNDVYDLFEPESGEQVVAEMIEAAQGSPRRLFQLFSAIIDAHLPANAAETGLTYSDWQEGKRRVALA